MRTKRIVVLGLTAVLVIAAVIRIVLRLSGGPIAVAQRIATVTTVPSRGGQRRPFYSPATDLSADGGVVVGAAQNGAAWVWRIGADGRPEQIAELGPLELKPDVPSLTSLRITPDARLVVSAFAVAMSPKKGPRKKRTEAVETGLVRIWNLEKRSNKTLATLPDAPDNVAISPRGEAIAVSAPYGRPLRVLDGETGKELWSDPNVSFGFEVAFSPDGKLLAACAGRSVRVYVARSGRIIRTCATAGGMESVCFSADSSRIAAGGADPNLYVWKVSESSDDVVLPLALPSGDHNEVRGVAFDANSDSLIAYLPRLEQPGIWEKLQHTPTPGVLHATGSVILRREISPRGAEIVLLSTDPLFDRVRFARNASRFVESRLESRDVGIWQF